MNTLLSHANSAQRLAQIERARQMVLHGQEDGQPAWVTPVIAQSWQRCLNMGHRPHHRVAFNTVSTAAMARATEASRQLLEAASPVVRSLSRAMLHTRYFAILTDAHGTVIDVQGPVDRQNRHVAAIARVGVDLSEASVGTTPIGTTLTDHQPVW